jgi:hypothetical protein
MDTTQGFGAVRHRAATTAAERAVRGFRECHLWKLRQLTQSSKTERRADAMLINLRNALMAGKRLPYDAEVEFLKSTGTQYIDTLVNAASNLSVEITMANAGTPWLNTNPTGAILVVSTSLQTRHHLSFTRSGVNYYYGNVNNPNTQTMYRPDDLVPFTFKVDSVNKTFTLGDYSAALPTYAFDTGLSFWLFGRNGTTPPYLGSLRIYSAKLWNGSILVRDFIPVRKGTVGYLYDRVSGKLFGNAGTGAFTYGNDLKYPIPAE